MEIVESPKKNNSFSYNNNDQINRNNSYHKNQIIEKLDKGKNLGTFILGQKLGSGTFGVVRLATHIITGEKVAVKILDKYKILKEADKRRLEREIKILKVLRHNNIVHLYNVIQTSSTIYLVMEYVDGKELFEYIVHKRRLSELEACKFYQQLISGVEYLGKLRVAHRDLKPENLLLDKKKNIKIVDFGLSNVYRNNELLLTACGSPCYAAPEMLSGKRYNGLQVDIWSSGIVLYAMICGTLPFEDPDNNTLYKKIKQGIFKIPEFVSDKAKDILHRILNIDPAKRYTVEQIKSHPWFNMINPKLYMSEGLLLNTYIVPIDEDIINQMSNEYEYNSIEVRINLLANKHNHLTTTYYLLLKKKLNKGEKSVCNTFSIEFIRYINNRENLLSNYKGNWKKLFKDRAREKNIKSKEFKVERKKSNNSKQEMQKSYKNISKFEPNENISKTITNSSTNTDKYDKKSSNVIKISKSLNNDDQYNNHINNNNENGNNIQLNINNEIKKEKNILNSSLKNKYDKSKNGKKDLFHPPVKKVTIFEYLKKIKELGNKKYSRDNKKNGNCSIEKDETIHTNINNLNGSRNNRIKKQLKKFKEYENKLKVDKTISNNNNRGKHKYSISTLNSNTIDKELYNQKFNKIYNNNLFDIRQYLKEKQNNFKTRNKNIFIDNDNINTNTTNNFYNKQKSRKNKDIIINDFATIDHDDYPIQITSQSKKSDKRYDKHKKGLESSKYVESKYFTKKNQDKSKDYLTNSYLNIDKTNVSNRNIKSRRRNNISYKTKSLNNKRSESSLKKRKKYCQSISSKLKRPKNDNKSTLLINRNYYYNNNVNNTIEIINSSRNMHKNHLSSLISNSSSKKTYSKGNNYILKTIDKENSYGVNYIVQKKMIKNGLFNSNNYNRKNFFNTSVSFEKTDGETSNDESQTKKINKINNNNYIFINVENYNEPINKTNYKTHKSSKDIESYYESNSKRKVKNKLYLEIKSKYKKFNNKQDFLNTNSKGNCLNVLTDLNYESKKNISKVNYNINNYQRRNRINKSVCLKNSTYENYRNAFCNNTNNTSHKKIFSKANIYNNSNKLILNNMPNYILNTQKQFKYIRKRKIINNDFGNTTDDFLGKSFVDSHQDKMNQTTFDSYDLNYNNNYIKNNISNNKCNKIIFPKKISYTSFDLNTVIYINDKKRLNLVINKELENKKIKYIFKNNKYLCWRNDNKLMIQLIKIGNNCYAINMHIIKQSNFFNVVFLKEFFKNIVNKYKLNK